MCYMMTRSEFKLMYSVFKKEGNKVNAYYTNKKRHFGSTMRFFPTTT